MQRAREVNWKDPLTYLVTAVILYQPGKSLADTRFLVVTRQKGAAMGHKQAHHGGFVKPTDQSLLAAAIREAREETGYILKPEDLHFLSMAGPELYRSTMTADDDKIVLTITDIQAEPTAPFVIGLFLSNVSNIHRDIETDGEVSNGEWMTFQDMIDAYGQSMTFNYWSFLYLVMSHLLGRSVPSIANTSPGTYLL